MQPSDQQFTFGDHVVNISPKAFATQSQFMRAVAGACFASAAFSERAGAAELRSRQGSEHIPTHAARYVCKWGLRTISGLGVVDAPRSGRPPTVTTAHVDAVAQRIAAGFTDCAGQQKHFPSWKAAFADPGVHTCVLAAGCSDAHMLRLLHDTNPQLAAMRMHYKKPLTPECMSMRVDVCQQLLKWRPAQMRRVFWLDAATIWVDVTDGTVIVDKDHIRDLELTQSHPVKPRYNSQAVKLRFYAVVNAIAGPVILVMTTGTTWLAEWRAINGLPVIYQVCYTRVRGGVSYEGLYRMHGSDAASPFSIMSFIFSVLQSAWCRRTMRMPACSTTPS